MADATPASVTAAKGWTERARVTPAVEAAVLLIAVAVAVGSYFVIESGEATQRLLTPPLVALLLVVNLVPGVALLMLLGRRIARRRAALSPIGGRGELHVRLVAIIGTYNGWGTAAYFCEEVIDPARSITRATFSGIALVTALYFLINLALLNQMTPAEMAGDTLVAATAAARIVGPRADFYVTAISLVSLVTITNMLIMQITRTLFAIARDAKVPVLSGTTPKGAPNAAMLTGAVLGAVFATIGIYNTLLALSTSLLVGVAAAVNLAAIVMRRREPALHRPYRMPFFPLPALFALTVNAALLVAFVYEDPTSAAAGAALMLALSGLPYGAIRWNRRRSA